MGMRWSHTGVPVRRPFRTPTGMLPTTALAIRVFQGDGSRRPVPAGSICAYLGLSVPNAPRSVCVHPGPSGPILSAPYRHAPPHRPISRANIDPYLDLNTPVRLSASEPGCVRVPSSSGSTRTYQSRLCRAGRMNSARWTRRRPTAGMEGLLRRRANHRHGSSFVFEGQPPPH